MPISQPTFRPETTVELEGSVNHKITNLAVPSAATEVSHALTSEVKQIQIRARNTDATLQFAFTALESGTKFVTIRKGTVQNLTGLKFTGETLYIQSDKASTTVEILELF